MFLGDLTAQSKVNFGGYDESLVDEAFSLRPKGADNKKE